MFCFLFVKDFFASCGRKLTPACVSEMLIRKHDDVTAIFYSKERRGEARLVEDLEVNISFLTLFNIKDSHDFAWKGRTRLSVDLEVNWSVKSFL
jgi:hypothetical protein